MEQESLTWVSGFPFLEYRPPRLQPEEMVRLSRAFYQTVRARRSIRDFSPDEVPYEVIENCLLAASTAPSGANKQPYTFCVVSHPDLKKKIREAAEKEEHESYHHRMSEEWLEDIKPLQTDWHKPFLETAPYLIVVFKRAYELGADKSKKNNYYVSESVGLACGLLLTALHQAGLSALTHTPSPMNFLAALLNRPENERPFLLIPVGYAADRCLVPDLKRKAKEEFIVRY